MINLKKKYSLPDDVVFIIKELNNKGFEAYTVGGCVRDILLGRIPNDWDITTSALPEEVKKVFKKTYDTGIEHGTVTTIVNNSHYEITTYRIDGEYEDLRRPTEVFYTKDLAEDLRRRDFTINAIAYHPELGFVDPFDGIKDIELETIRGVGEPAKRFEEDALRILRCVRFSAQLDFKIDVSTHEALIKTVDLIENISIERIRDEFHKIILSNKPEKLILLQEYKILNYISPSIFEYLQSNLDLIVNSLSCSENNIQIRLPLFYQFMDIKNIKSTLTFLRLDNKTIAYVQKQISIINLSINTDYDVRKLISCIGIYDFPLTIDILKIIYKVNNHKNLDKIDFIMQIFEETEKNHYCLSIKELDIDGNDLMELGIAKGKLIGGILAELLDEVLRTPNLNERSLLICKAKHLSNID